MSTPRRRLARPVLATLLATLLLALTMAGCTQQSTGQSPRDALAAAKRHLDHTSGVHVVISTDQLPAGVSGIVSADGVATHAPAFKGHLKVSVRGLTANVAVVSLDGKVHAKLPFTTRFVVIDPHDYGAPDPAELMSTTGGLSSLLTSATGVAAGKQQRLGGTVVTGYAATVPGKAMQAVIPSAKRSARFAATFKIDAHHNLREAVLTGPFYAKRGSVTYTIDFDRYGSHPSIAAP